MELMTRESWNHYFMNIAKQVATRATCDRKHVGCVIVSQARSIVATGYNGSVRGLRHCDDEGHDMENGSCQRTVHAEINAIAQAAAGNGGLKGSTAYVTAQPCWNCAKALANAGVASIVYLSSYRPNPRLWQLGEVGIDLLELVEEAEGRLVEGSDECDYCRGTGSYRIDGEVQECECGAP